MKTINSHTTCWFLICMIFGFYGLSFAQEEYQPEQLFAMSLTELMDVEMEIATAGKIPEKIAEIPASVVLIEREDIEASGFRTLAEILGHVPGLFPIDDYSWGGVNFGVRGFWSGVANRNIIILVNGVNQLSDYEANFSLSKINVPVEAIDRIEIVRGPMSVVYGSGAFFGVINIITNELTNSEPVRLVSASYGSLDFEKVALRISEKFGDFQYVANASLYQTDGIDVPLKKLVNQPDRLLQYNVSPDSRTRQQLQNQEKYFNFSAKSSRLLFDFSFVESHKEMYTTVPSSSQGSIMHATKTNLAIEYRKDIIQKLLFRAKISYHHAQYPTEYDYYFKDIDVDQEVGETAYEGEVNLYLNLNNNFDMMGGFLSRTALNIYNVITAPSMGDPFLYHTKTYLDDGSKLITRAFFIQMNVEPFARLKVVGGVRLEQTPNYTIGLSTAPDSAFKPANVMEANYSYDNWAIIPRFAVLYNLNKNHILKFLYGQAINRPSFQQNIDKFLGIQKDLVPEKIRTYEINYLSCFFPGFTTGINLFRNELTDMLVRDHGLAPDSTYYSFFSNIGKMDTYGTEITLMAEPVRKKLLVEASITYQKTEDKRQPDIDVAYSPNWLGYFKATLKPMKHYTVCLTMRYVDRMLTYWDPIQQNADGSLGGRIGNSVQGYTSVGINVRIDDLLLPGLFLNVRGSNLLNKDIYYPTFTNNQWADRGTLAEPRTFVLTLGAKY